MTTPDPPMLPFRAVLTPHRSLSQNGFLLLMAGVAIVSFTAGVVFWRVGAWPVSGFLGLDVALIWLAFRLNFRSARACETIDIDDAALVLTRKDAAGARERVELNPYWARVRLEERTDGRCALAIVSHGRSFAVGRFLADEERRELAGLLSRVLAETRR